MKIKCIIVALSCVAMFAVQANCGKDFSCRNANPVTVHARQLTATTDLPYTATNVKVNTSKVRDDNPVTISGQVVDGQGGGVPFAELIAVIAYEGFEVPIALSSDADGQFAVDYHATGTVSGLHTVSVIHPDAFADADARPQQASFTVVRSEKAQRRSAYADVQFAQDLLKTGVPFNSRVTESITLDNRGTAVADNVTIALTSANNFSWGYVSSQRKLNKLNAGEQWGAELSFAPPDTFTQEGVFDFTLTMQYGTEPNIVTRQLPISVTVTTDEVGGYTFRVEDMYTDYSGSGGNNGVENARIMLTRDGVPIAAGAGRTGADGRFTYADLPKGFYDYQISADKHTTKSGEVYVSAGIVREESIFLDIPVVKVDWSVTETVIEDTYDIVVDATYETDVPAPVIVIEPAVIVLPAMQTGDEISGAIKITNRGLIAMNDVVPDLPADDKYLDYTFNVDAVPDKLLPMQTVYLPYRIKAKRNLELDPADTRSLSQQTMPWQKKNTPQPRAVCYRSFGYSKGGRFSCDFTCSNGTQQSCSPSGFSIVYTGDKESYNCTGGEPTHYWWTCTNTVTNCKPQKCKEKNCGGGPGIHRLKPGGYEVDHPPPGFTPCAPDANCSCCSGNPNKQPPGGPGGYQLSD